MSRRARIHSSDSGSASVTSAESTSASSAQSAAQSDGEARLHVSSSNVALVACALLALWMFDLYVLRTNVLYPWRGQGALTPLYAFWIPYVIASALVFPILAAAFAWIAPRLTDPERTSRRVFVGALLASAVLLPVALYCVRETPNTLGLQFTLYLNEEFFQDAAHITDWAAFLEHYVELMPHLSLHGQHFPPGHASLLYAVAQVFGPSYQAAAICVLAIAALGVFVSFLALREIADERAARQGACLLLAVPSLIDFTCVSMDAVFFTFAALAWWLALRAFSQRGSLVHAVLAGVALFVATCFSFSTLPLGLAIGAYAAIAGRKDLRRTIQRLLVVGAVYAACAVLLYGLSGFAIWGCLAHAQTSSVEFMQRVHAGALRVDRGRIDYGNGVAFLIGCGVALVAAAAVALRSRRTRSHAWTLAALLALVTMGLVYWMETERIWLFAMPWVVAMAVMERPLEDRSLIRLLGAGLAQAFLMEALLFTLW